MKHEGLASFPHILTEADVLFHCYGIAYEAAEKPALAPAVIPESAPILKPEPIPVVIPEPAPVVIPEPAPVPEPESQETPSPAPLTLEEMTAKLISENSKAVLVAKAEQAGIDSSGTKSEVATRLASHIIGA